MEPERCAECGFDATLLTTADAVAALRSMGRRWRAALKDVPEDRLRQRPEALVWSPLEYAAHTRDVLALVGWGMNKALEGSRPVFDAVEPDPPGTDHGYNVLDPPSVLGELGSNAERIARRADRALPEHWKRTATSGDSEVDAGWLLRHAVHDASHHLRDVERDLRSDR
ncbi:MAG: DinB family protein [Actinomycetota bacterium]